MKRTTRGIVAAVITGLFAFASRAGAQPVADPQQIYVQAMSAMRALPLPQSIAYQVDASGSIHAECDPAIDQGRFRLELGRASGRFAITYFPDTDEAQTEDLTTHKVCKGHGAFSPMPDMRPQKPAKQRNGDEVLIDDGLRYAVNDVRNIYTIALKNAPDVDGHPVYQLVFTRRSPNRDDDFNEPLREMLVDRETSRIREIRFGESMGNFMGALGFDAAIKLGAVNDYWVVTDFTVSGTGRLMIVHKRLDITEHAHDFVFLARKQANTKKP